MHFLIQMGQSVMDWPNSSSISEAAFQDNYGVLESKIVATCRDINSCRSFEKLDTYTRMVIQRLFHDPSIDLCSILPPAKSTPDDPYNMILDLINSKSLFFEAIMEGSEQLANELWEAVFLQLERTQQNVSTSNDSVLLFCISSYVIRLLPIDQVPLPAPRQTGHIQRMRTPLDLFLPTSSILNRMNLDSSEQEQFVSCSLHPRHLTIFCNFVSIICSSDQFPSANRLLLLRYLLKQFHTFCLFDSMDDDVSHIKATIHANPPFSPALFVFLHTFLERCPSVCSLQELIGVWSTFCRPWRYIGSATSSDGHIQTSKWFGFVKAQERFYRIILGKILRKLTEGDVTPKSIKIVRSIAEWSWKEPMMSVLRVISVDPTLATMKLLDNVRRVYVRNEAALADQKRKKKSMWELLVGATESPEVQAAKDVNLVIEPLLKDADFNLGTQYACDHQSSESAHDSTSIPQLSDTPKRGYLPDHNKDPVTGLLYLTPLGREQVLKGERKFDFSTCQVRPAWMASPREFECGPLVILAQMLTEYLNTTRLGQLMAEQYNSTAAIGPVLRLVMEPPFPNPSYPIQSPVFCKTIRKTPPSLRIRVFANYGVLLLVLLFVLFQWLGPWIFAPVIIGLLVFVMVCLAGMDS